MKAIFDPNHIKDDLIVGQQIFGTTNLSNLKIDFKHMYQSQGSSFKTDSDVEDSEKEFEIVEDHCKPQFTIKFDHFQQSNNGDYIVYEMVIQWLESTHPIWILHKRYSDFVAFHDQMKLYFQ